MSFANTSRAIYVYVNNVDVSTYLIDGELSDTSAYTDTIIQTTGTITLGGSTLILDFDRSLYPIGSAVGIWVQLDNGEVALHPKGTLYVINSSVDVETRQLSLEVGCSLAFISDKEDSYADAVEGLFDDMLLEETKESFTIENKDLSTLSSLLEVEGSIIYQDPYGNIQKVPAFGEDGLGSNISSSKLTSFDYHTAISIESIANTSIEDNVSSVSVEATIDVPGAGDQIDPLITSVTERLIEQPRFYLSKYFKGSDRGYAWIVNEENAPLTSETNPNCGTIESPNETANGIGYNYQAFCYPGSGFYEVAETVTNGSYKSYNGPGNQVDREESWEHCSAATFANAVLTNLIDGNITQVSESLSEANGLLQKANQHFDQRDSYFSNNVVLLPGGGWTINPALVYHECNAQAFYNEAVAEVEYIQDVCKIAVNFGLDSASVYGVSTFSQTFNYFGKGGEVVKTITREYQNRSSFENNTTYTIVFDSVGNDFRINAITPDGINVATLYTDRPVPTGPINNPKDYDLYIISESVTTYTYGKTVTVEVEEFQDFLNPSNNYKRTNYSSNGNTSAEEPDRLISTTSVNGIEYCDDSTDTKDMTATVEILDSSIINSTAWFGNAQPYEKKVTMPVDFVPVLPIYDPDTDSCIPVDESEILAKYERIMQNYADIIGRKITGDNRGFRITEKLRAEIFEYYPFYPVTISTQSLSRAFTARVASSNWVFDNQNAVCSFDCLISGDIEPPTFADPAIKTTYLKTETVTTLTVASLELGETTASIEISSLPTDGDLFLNGIAVSISDQILVTDINSGLLTFVPSAAGTSIIDFQYSQLSNTGTVLSSNQEIYPLLTSELITPDNYGADGGEFTLNTTNDGLDVDGGDLDAGSSNGGPSFMEAGDFDTGTSVSAPPPGLPSGYPVGNASVDPEAEFGIYVKDQSDNQISIDTLPTITGDIDPIYGIIINLKVEPSISVRLTYSQVDWIGWTFGSIVAPLSNDLDMGSFATPNLSTYDFGTFSAAIEPSRPSYVS